MTKQALESSLNLFGDFNSASAEIKFKKWEKLIAFIRLVFCCKVVDISIASWLSVVFGMPALLISLINDDYEMYSLASF